MTWFLSRISPVMLLIGFLTACGCACWVMFRHIHRERTLALIARDERYIAELRHVIGPLCSNPELRPTGRRNFAVAALSKTDPDAVTFARDVASTLPVNVTDAELVVEAPR